MIEKFKIRKVYSGFMDNIWAVDLAEMRSLFSFNCGIKNLLCVIDVFTICTCFKHLTNKKSKTVLNGFIEIEN